MRKLNLWLPLGLVVACSNPLAEVATEGTTSESSPTTGSPTSTPNDSTSSSVSTAMSVSSGEEVCPPMPPDEGSYDPCPGVCGGGGQCFSDNTEYAVCTRGCFMDCNCWAAPNDGDAPARCSGALLESTSVCVLDCSGGESCPRGMFCVADLEICAFPYPGSETATGTDSSSGSSSDSGSTGSTGGSSDSGSTGGSSGSTGGSSGSTGGSSDSGSTGGSSGSTGGSSGGATGTSTT